MFCKYCGQQLPDGSRFCRACGMTLDPAGQQPQQPQSPQIGQQSQQAQQIYQAQQSQARQPGQMQSPQPPVQQQQQKTGNDRSAVWATVISALIIPIMVVVRSACEEYTYSGSWYNSTKVSCVPEELRSTMLLILFGLIGLTVGLIATCKAVRSKYIGHTICVSLLLPIDMIVGIALTVIEY